MPFTTRTLLDTTHSGDARFLGFDAACNPHEDGEGLFLTVEDHPQVGPCFRLSGPEGEVELVGERAARAVAEAILQRLQYVKAAA